MAIGKIKDLYPPGNNGSHPGSGRIAEDGTGNVYVFQTPRDLDGDFVLTAGTPVNFDLSNGNSVSNVRQAITIAVTLTAGPVQTIETPNSTYQQCTLSWTSQGADSLQIDNLVGAVPTPSGSIDVRVPARTVTFTITATNAAGQTATASVSVTGSLL
jgi:hypothetical protein